MTHVQWYYPGTWPKYHGITLVHGQKSQYNLGTCPKTTILTWYMSEIPWYYSGTCQNTMVLPRCMFSKYITWWYILKTMILPWYMSNSYIQYFMKTKYTRDIRLNGHVEWSTVVKDDQTNETVNNTHVQKRVCVMETLFTWTVLIGWALPSADWSNTLHCTGL